MLLQGDCVAGTLEKRFWAKVQPVPSGCWEWTASLYKNGYGKLGAEAPSKSTVYAHRVAWEVNHGPIPAGMLVCHKCDNRICVRPDHLFLGTAKDNSQDCLAKGRQVPGRLPGEKHHQAILKEVQVLEIKHRTSQGERGVDLAKEFGVTPETIYSIHAGRSWAYLWK